MSVLDTGTAPAIRLATTPLESAGITAPTATTDMTIDHLHYDVIRAKPDGSCSRPAETGLSFPGRKASARVVLKRCRIEH